MDNKDLLKQYVDTGSKISRYQMNKLPPNLLSTYLRKRMIMISTLNSNDDTGVVMVNDEGQVFDIDDGYKIEPYEYRLFDDTSKKSYINWIMDIGMEPEFPLVDKNDSDDVKEFYVKKIIENGWYLNSAEFSSFNDDLKLLYINYILKSGKLFFPALFKVTPDNLLDYYFSYKKNHGIELNSWDREAYKNQLNKDEQ